MTKDQSTKPTPKLILTTLLKFARPYRRQLILVIFSAVAATVIGAFVGPFIISQIINSIQQGSISLTSASGLIAAFIATQVANIVLWRLNIYLLWNLDTLAQKDIFETCFKQIIKHGLDFHADNFGGSLVSQTNKLVGAFERLIDGITFNLIPLAISLISATAILGFLFWPYAIVLAIVSVIFITAVWFGSRTMTPKTTAEAKASSKISGHLSDVVSNIMAIKSYAAESSERQTATEVVDTWVDRQFAIRNQFLKLSFGYSSIAGLLRIAALIAAILASQHSLIPIGTVFLIMSYTMTVVDNLWQTNRIMRDYNHIIGQSTEMVRILHLPISITDRSKKRLKVKKGEIRFDQVDFSHQADEQLFKDFDLTIKAGQKIGLVGKSGSGKTSLTKLLLRFHDLPSGSISIDNQDISQVAQASLHQAIAYVPQEPLLFHRSLRDNISYGNPKASFKAIKQAAKQASADEFIDNLPDGYDTMVGERGVKLSGGQRQRIIIARAILKNAPILVLDEATSALDSDSEAKIQAAMDELMKGRTSIVIAHRLSTIAKLDRILVLDQGKIIEDGTHRQLLAKKGEYAKLWQRQSGGFIQED